MYLWVIGALLVLVALAVSYVGSHPEGVLDGKPEGDVRTLVGAFGNQLNTVSLRSPEVADEIQKAYGPYAAPELLMEWIADPLAAPGRLSSSPWPDHIEIESVFMTMSGTYEVAGQIKMVTSSGDAADVPVALTVSQREGRFLITKYREDRPMSAEALPRAGATETLTAALGETVTAFGVAFTPEEVIEDSRCPANANCIQAGTVRVKGRFEDGMGSSEVVFGLDTGMSGPISGETAFVTLTEVTPAKSTSSNISSLDYRFTFRIEYR